MPCGFNSSKISLFATPAFLSGLLGDCFVYLCVCVEAVEKMNFAGRFQCGVQLYFRMCFI